MSNFEQTGCFRKVEELQVRTNERQKMPQFQFFACTNLHRIVYLCCDKEYRPMLFNKTNAWKVDLLRVDLMNDQSSR